jgi:lipopolysaccharide transport system permease protein
VRFGVGGQLHYVVFVFSGLIPYIGFMEATVQSCVAIKQNIHLIKNVMLPIELIPARVVAVSMITQMISMSIIIVLTSINGTASWHLLWLPVVFALQIIFLLGLSWILACLGVAILDVGYFINLFVLLLMFISPIGFTLDMVPDFLKIVCYLNPIYYMTEMYRGSLLTGSLPDVLTMSIYVVMCCSSFVFGSIFFRRFKNFLVDYE